MASRRAKQAMCIEDRMLTTIGLLALSDAVVSSSSVSFASSSAAPGQSTSRRLAGGTRSIYYFLIGEARFSRARCLFGAQTGVAD